ncbi:MAG: ATP-dependent helicase [candidate division KSB1 bacterium]|nr:ATP-dependent helicase [candidate division KSB1 bacterium]MDZ7406527.1 ATP-dependent helicase [candidate division KSB1 bacterium]
MMRTKELMKAWEELSPIQRKAAEWDDGPLLVLAGPGSGKTKVLTCRIARLLESSHDKNFRILGLTFTNKAADEMRNRVASFVPGQEGRLFLGTFHSFCSEVLRQHGTHLGINPNFHIYSQDVDLQAVLNDAVEEAKKTSNVVSDLDKKTLPVIQRLKSLLILPDQCRERFPDKEFGERMAAVYPAYETELCKRNALDFNSLILKTYQLFTKFPVFAKRYRTVYPYICIDEFQDTNQAQYGLIRALAGDQHRNLFVVADDDQIIYQWNGASHERLKELLNDFSPRVIQLPMNYRCPPEIVELANNLIRHNFLRTADKKPLEAFRHGLGQGTVRLLECFPDFEAEAAGVAKDIKNLHSGHLGSVVVLGRNRKLLDGVDKALQDEGLPAVISQRKDEFESTPFVWLHSILRLANDGQNRSYLEAVCGAFAQLTQVEIDVEDVISQAQALSMGYLQSWIRLVNQKTTDALVKKIVNETSRCLVRGRDFQTFSKSALAWFTSLAQAQRQAENDPSNEIFARYDEEKLVWEELMREIKRNFREEPTLEAFLQELQMRSKEPLPKPNTVVLMTIHGAKGKEFDHVYLIGLVDDELPSFQSKKKGDKSLEMEEERRNCFVAITRTIKTLTLSYAQKYRGWPKKPSRFLFEMGLLK